MRRKTAIILSGGGARGAYEVGVLSYVFGELTRQRKRPPRVDVLSGTSVGAINAVFLAQYFRDPEVGVRKLVDLWRGIALDDILGFGPRHVLALPRVFTGSVRLDGAGVFDVSPITALVEREVSWKAIEAALRDRHLGLLSVSTTEVSTGRTVVFMQTGPEGALPSTAPPRTLLRAARIGPEHALASAAIPILFPPVRIGGELYYDGGVRQNTPISPALRAGATHIFAIGLSREERGIGAGLPDGKAPGAAFLLGKVLNAVLLDHIDSDVDYLRRMNAVIDDGERAFGPGFSRAMSEQAHLRGAQDYRRIHPMVVRPTEDIGRMAAEQIRSGKTRSGSAIVRRVLSMLDVGVGTESDLVSYLLFDGAFASRLIDLGRADAEARRDDLLAFFDGDDDVAPSNDEGGGSMGPYSVLPPPVIG